MPEFLNIMLKLLFVLGGLWTFWSAFSDNERFMNHHKARFIIAIFGRLGARIFYMLIGLLLFVLGVLAVFGVVSLHK